MTTRKRSRSRASPPKEPLARFRYSLERGDDWFGALLEAIARWETSEEEVGDRRYRYLIGGEAFDWLLLAERLCEVADGVIPAEEKEALLFFGKTPQELDAEGFKRAIGAAKHRAHLNFLYGIVVEEALQLVVEEEVLKRHLAHGLEDCTGVEREVFEQIYSRDRDDLFAAYWEERGSAPPEEISYNELREFTYWLFKYRVRQSDPARVASDTRRALTQVSRLEAAAQRWRGRQTTPATEAAAVAHGEVVDGEVVARIH